MENTSWCCFFNDLYTNDEFCEDKSYENHACPVDMIFPVVIFSPFPVSTRIHKCEDYTNVLMTLDRLIPLPFKNESLINTRTCN